MTSDSELVKMKNLFIQATRVGLDICEIMERGQGDAPLTDRFKNMVVTLNSPALPVALAGLSDGSTRTALAWLSGLESSATATFPWAGEVGLVEIYLKPGRFGIQTSDGTWTEFEAWDELLGAVARVGQENGEGRFKDHPMLLHFPDRGRLGAVHFIVAANTEKLLESPLLLSRFTSGSNFMILSGPENHKLSDANRAFIDDTAKEMDAIWPVVLRSSEAPSPENGWWNDPLLKRISRTAAPAFIAGPRSPDLPRMFQDREDFLRNGLWLKHMTRQLSATSAVLAERCTRQVQQLSRKRAVLEQNLRSIDKTVKESDLKPVADAMRISIEDEVARIVEEIEQQNRVAFSPTGEIIRELVAFTQSLDGLDEGETTPKSIRLEVPPAFVMRLKQMIEDAVTERLHEDIVSLKNEIGALETKVSNKLSQYTRSPVSIEGPSLDEAQIWAAIQPMISVEIRSKGEIPKQSLFKALSGGRQKAFMIIITLNLLMGSLLAKGTNLRTALGAGVIILFAVGVISSIISARKDKQELMLKELERVRDTLLGEGKRLLNESQKEKLARISSYSSDFKKRTLRKVDEILKDAHSSSVAASETEKLTLQGKLQSIASQTKQLEESAKQVGKLDGSVKELDSSVSQYVARTLTLLVAKEAEAPREEESSVPDADAKPAGGQETQLPKAEEQAAGPPEDTSKPPAAPEAPKEKAVTKLENREEKKREPIVPRAGSLRDRLKAARSSK